jgi:hypothetical protein
MVHGGRELIYIEPEFDELEENAEVRMDNRGRNAAGKQGRGAPKVPQFKGIAGHAAQRPGTGANGAAAGAQRSPGPRKRAGHMRPGDEA